MKVDYTGKRTEINKATSWLPDKAKGRTEGFKNIGTRPLIPLRRLDIKSEPSEGETRFLMSWYNLPPARDFKSRRRESIPLLGP